MSTQDAKPHGSNRTIITGLIARVIVAIAKFVAWAFSGSSSMLAAGVHSLADISNQLLLLRGGSVSRRRADAQHPFGFGRERYGSTFVFSIFVYSISGVFSLVRGAEKLTIPHSIDNSWLPILVLVVAIILESLTLRGAIRRAAVARGQGSWVQFIRHSKAPDAPIVLLVNGAALAGLIFALVGIEVSRLTGIGLYDAIASLCIGALLLLMAIVLGIETKSLLVGKGASAADIALIHGAIESEPQVESVIHMKTLSLGPDELLLAAKVSFAGSLRFADIARAIHSIEVRVRLAVPSARVIYIEPDIFVAPGHEVVLTEAIIIRSAD